MVEDFLDACPNVRSLSVVENNGVWSNAFAEHLEKLEAVSNSMKGTIPNFCPSLLALNFYYKRNTENEFPCLRESAGN